MIFHSILGTLGAIVLFFSVGPYRWTLATVGRPDSAVEKVEMVGELHSRPHPLTVAYCWLFPLLLIRQSPDWAVGGLRVTPRGAGPQSDGNAPIVNTS